MSKRKQAQIEIINLLKTKFTHVVDVRSFNISNLKNNEKYLLVDFNTVKFEKTSLGNGCKRQQTIDATISLYCKGKHSKDASDFHFLEYENDAYELEKLLFNAKFNNISHLYDFDASMGNIGNASEMIANYSLSFLFDIFEDY